MVGTIKKSLQKMSRGGHKDRDTCLRSALYGYRRKPGADGASPFEVLFGVKPRIAIDGVEAVPEESIVANARPLELALALIMRAERLIPRIESQEAIFEIGDLVLLRRGNQPRGSKFEARMWLGPFEVVSVHHPRYTLKNAPGRKSRKPVHLRRLRKYYERNDEQIECQVEDKGHQDH